MFRGRNKACKAKVVFLEIYLLVHVLLPALSSNFFFFEESSSYNPGIKMFRSNASLKWSLVRGNNVVS